MRRRRTAGIISSERSSAFDGQMNLASLAVRVFVGLWKSVIMWAIMNDNKVDPVEITSLRSEIFNKLIFYLDDSQIKAISSELGNLKSDSSDQEYVSAFENITKVLRASILGGEQDDSKTEIKTLWNRFNSINSKFLFPSVALASLSPSAFLIYSSRLLAFFSSIRLVYEYMKSSGGTKSLSTISVVFS